MPDLESTVTPSHERVETNRDRLYSHAASGSSRCRVVDPDHIGTSGVFGHRRWTHVRVTWAIELNRSNSASIG